MFGKPDPSNSIFEVMHLENLLAPVSHFEDFNALDWVDLHRTVCLYSIQHSFVLMVIHLSQTGAPQVSQTKNTESQKQEDQRQNQSHSLVGVVLGPLRFSCLNIFPQSLLTAGLTASLHDASLQEESV